MGEGLRAAIFGPISASGRPAARQTATAARRSMTAASLTNGKATRASSGPHARTNSCPA